MFKRIVIDGSPPWFEVQLDLSVEIPVVVVGKLFNRWPWEFVVAFPLTPTDFDQQMTFLGYCRAPQLNERVYGSEELAPGHVVPVSC